MPERPKGIVLFAHGTGSSRKSPRNQFVANVLNAGGLAALLLDLRAGYFGASTGAAAAIVSRGGRPDLAGDALTCVKSPTMLIVGGDDPEVLALNRRASTRMSATHEIVIVPGASHLFQEPERSKKSQCSRAIDLRAI